MNIFFSRWLRRRGFRGLWLWREKTVHQAHAKYARNAWDFQACEAATDTRQA